MGDFVMDTALEEVEDRRYRIDLCTDWMTWGPAGGYVAAIALRAAGRATKFERPATFVCQFLAPARFATVELQVQTLRAGRRSEVMRVSMTQEATPILEANVWATDAGEGMQHDFTRAPEVPGFESLKDVRELEPDRRQLGIYQNFDRRPVDWQHRTGGALPEPREPVMRGWCRFQPTHTAEDRFVDSLRSVILLDSFSWPATWPAYPSDQPSPWIAPNLDLHVRFHHDSRPHDWLLCETRAELADEGLIGTTGTLWSDDGRLLAASSSQLFCRPRPERFR